MSDTIRKLQQRIDKQSNYITENAAEYQRDYKPAWKEIVAAHTLDKRIMGELISQQALLETYLHHSMEM